MTDSNGDGGQNELALWLGVGVAVGAGVGTLLSVALENAAFLAVGVGPGLTFGAAIGIARSSGDSEDDAPENSGQEENKR